MHIYIQNKWIKRGGGGCGGVEVKEAICLKHKKNIFWDK